MIGLFLFQMLKRLRIHHNLASLICIAMIYLYGIMTGFSVSTNRAVVMMCLSLASCLVGRTYDSKSALAASGIWILLQQPYQLFQSGFLLSYLAVTGVVWLYPLCKEYLDWLFPDFIKKMEQKAKSEYHSIGVAFYRILKIFGNSLLISCCIQLITLPVLLCSFYELASLAPIINLFVLPLSSLLIIMAILVGIVGTFCLPVGYFLAGSVHVILAFYHFLCEIFQKIPGQNVITGCPRPWQTVAFVLLFIAFFYGVSRKIHKLAGVLVLLAVAVILFRVPVSGLQVTMLDVGQGDSIFWETREGVTCLVDGGSSSVRGVGTYRILPFLKYSGVQKLDYCFMTHMDEDHINGIQELVKACQEPGAVKIKTMVFPRLSNPDDTYKEMVQEVEKAHIRVVYMERGGQLESGSMKITCMHPDNGFLSEDRNSASLVLELTYDSFAMLLTGDVDMEGEAYMLSHMAESKNSYDVLKVAHHGSKSSTGKEWLERIQPKNAFLSCGRKNKRVMILIQFRFPCSVL